MSAPRSTLPSTYSQDRRSGLILPSSLASRRRLEAAAEFRAATASRLRAGWNLGRSNSTPSSWSLQTLRNYSYDLDRNDPVASGATETMGINIVGRGLQPQSRLRAEMLGISEDRANELRRQLELIFETWKPLADSANRLDFDELQFVALRQVVQSGESIALPVMCEEAWRPLSRAIELLESDRLTGLSAQTQTGRETGIDVGARGEPEFYNFTKVNPQRGIANYGGDIERLAARDDLGRPRVIHVFRAQRPGQMRGIPYFAPVITYFQDLADTMEARVVAEKVAAFLGVFITRGDPTYAAQGAATDQEFGTGRNIQDLELGEINYLNVGEAIHTVDPNRSGENFKNIVEAMLRIIGVGLGLPYELLAKDFSKTNYSSARAALLEGRRLFTTWRDWFARKFCQPPWELVLEEAYLRGMFQAPHFYENRTEYLRAAWMGGGWGWVDPVKEIGASFDAINGGLSTYAKELAAQGEDWEEIFDQRAREIKGAQERKLVFIAPKILPAPEEPLPAPGKE